MSYVECVVEYTEEFETWWDTLSVGEQEAVAAKVGLLERHGPGLRRPHSGQIDGSKHPNMKELIVQYAGDPYRVLYAFDPVRCAVLLIGGKRQARTAGMRNTFRWPMRFSTRISPN